MCGFSPKIPDQSQIKAIAKAVHDEMYSIENTLKRRGYVYKGEGNLNNVILPNSKADTKRFFEYMGSRTFRNILKKCAEEKQGIQLNNPKYICSQTRLQEYFHFLETSGILVKESKSSFSFSPNVNNFGHTLEWYVSELFKNDLGCTSSWGVRVEDIDMGGDLDVLARIEASLVYVETKSSSPSNISESEIRNFLQRDQNFDPNMSIFLVDTRNDLDSLIKRFEDIINEADIKQRPNRDPNFRDKIEKPPEYPGIYFTSRRVFITNSKPSPLTQLRRCLNYYFTILPTQTYFSREGRLNYIK
jgi:hypothetical protein